MVVLQLIALGSSSHFGILLSKSRAIAHSAPLLHALIAALQPVVFTSVVEQLCGQVGVEGAWQGARCLGRAQILCRVLAAAPFALEKAVKAANGAQQALQAARCQPMLMLAGDEVAQVLGVQLAPAGQAAFGPVQVEAEQVVAIGFDGKSAAR